MILQALVKYYEALEENGKVAKQGWCDAKVSYGIHLSKEGQIQNIIWLKEPSANGKKLTPKIMKVPEMATRASGILANFLCDNAKYLLGIDKERTNTRVKECFQAAKEKHLQILKKYRRRGCESNLSVF